MKTVAGTPGERRIEGRLDDASSDADGSIRLAGRVIAYAEIDKARLVVSWGPPPKPGKDVKARRTPHPKAVAAAAALAAANAAAGIVATEATDDDLDDDADDEFDDDELDEADIDFDDSADDLDDEDDDEDDPAAPATDEHEGDDV